MNDLLRSYILIIPTLFEQMSSLDALLELKVDLKSDSDPDPNPDSESDTSTAVYDQEPFEKFKLRVLELCQKVLAPSAHAVSVERLRGGGFNRIVGILIRSDEGAASNQYVLRVPRFEAAQLDRDLAPLRLLRQESKIRIPDVIAFDTTVGNVLQSPYMIQTRIPGAPLLPVYPDLPHEMRCAIAKELGAAFSQMNSIRSTVAGTLTLSPSHESFVIKPFHGVDSDLGTPYRNGSATEATLDMLHATLRRKRERFLVVGQEDSVRVSFYDAFIIMAIEMADLGVLDENYFCLCHLDLEPRNVLVCRPSPTHPEAITGILDWDSALFAPPFMSCSPPMWLWAWNDEDDEDERLANETPPNAQLRELKQLFEEAAGSAYSRFAYGPQYRLARQHMRFTMDGLQSNEDFVRAESLLGEWAEVQKSLKRFPASVIVST